MKLFHMFVVLFALIFVVSAHAEVVDFRIVVESNNQIRVHPAGGYELVAERTLGFYEKEVKQTSKAAKDGELGRDGRAQRHERRADVAVEQSLPPLVGRGRPVPVRFYLTDEWRKSVSIYVGIYDPAGNFLQGFDLNVCVDPEEVDGWTFRIGKKGSKFALLNPPNGDGQCGETPRVDGRPSSSSSSASSRTRSRRSGLSCSVHRCDFLDPDTEEILRSVEYTGYCPDAPNVRPVCIG